MLFENFVNMDVLDFKISLHPKASEFLFEHYLTMRKVFSNVLGQLETDYISIALINRQQQIFFLSSKPSIEQNLIEKNIWAFDGCYQSDFIYQDKPKLWSEIPPLSQVDIITKYKQKETGFVTGIYIPLVLNSYRVVLSFGFKRIYSPIQNKTALHCERLSTIGKYAINQIQECITFPDKQTNPIVKPKLTLIVNNRVNYEYT